jgi:hypothetical protein
MNVAPSTNNDSSQAHQKYILPNPYEQFYMQLLHKIERLIPRQNTGELNPLFKLAFDPHLPILTQPVEQQLPYSAHS